jgi:hypothetical protein
MGIYRGPGGVGDAVNDASSEAAITVLARDEAVAARNAAVAAEVAAELAETNAEAAQAAAQAAQAAAEAASLPSQTSNSGKYLKTNGSTPSWDNLDISTADISGTLPVANGGTGSTTAANALTALGAYAATNPSGYTTNTGTVTSVAGTGTVNGLSLSGTVTTTGNVTLGGTLDLSAPPAIGGTTPAAVTATTLRVNSTLSLAGETGTAGQLLTSNGASAPTWQAAPVSLPLQTGNTGKYLTTDGSAASWDALATVANSGSYNDLTDKPTLTTNLDGLTDVAITSPSTDQVLKYNGSGWVNGAAPAGGQYFGTAAVKAIAYNASTIGENITVTENALSVGPITINSGFAVTVNSGKRWVVL